MVALNEANLAQLPARIARPGYDRRRITAGIAHLSVGNFHRAHQAVYLDRCLRLPGQESWGICGVGVIDDAAERAKAQGLTRQNGLYTLSIFPPGARAFEQRHGLDRRVSVRTRGPAGGGWPG